MLFCHLMITLLGTSLQQTRVYLLNSESPVGHFHRNKSDIVHFFHMGDAFIS